MLMFLLISLSVAFVLGETKIETPIDDLKIDTLAPVKDTIIKNSFGNETTPKPLKVVNSFEAIIKKIMTKEIHALYGCGIIALRINSDRSNTWKAVPEPFIPPYSKIGYVKLQDRTTNEVLSLNDELDDECPPGSCPLPLEYDARLSHIYCPSISKPLNQGCNCRGSWAVSAASAFSDRLCIATHGVFNLDLSAQQLLSCCPYCTQGSGCDGGDSVYAWVYFREKGIVTGSQWGSGTGCQPYSVAPCLENKKYENSTQTHICTNECQTLKSTKRKFERPFKTKSAFILRSPTVLKIKREIIRYGPITAEIKVFEDLHCYQSGIYDHVVGDFLGFKSIKLIGWGQTERGDRFWLATNTWGASWGENGFFRIKMGSDDSIVEFATRAGRMFEDKEPIVEYLTDDDYEGRSGDHIPASKTHSEICEV